jgi:hypothetical protein
MRVVREILGTHADVHVHHVLRTYIIHGHCSDAAVELGIVLHHG